jgi:hypothetical protein
VLISHGDATKVGDYRNLARQGKGKVIGTNWSSLNVV